MACIVDDKAVTCATFYPEISEKSSFEIQYRLGGWRLIMLFSEKDMPHF